MTNSLREILFKQEGNIETKVKNELYKMDLVIPSLPHKEALDLIKEIDQLITVKITKC